MKFSVGYEDERQSIQITISGKTPNLKILDELVAQAKHACSNYNRINLIIEDIGPNAILVIKEVRASTGLGLKEAKDLVDRVRDTKEPALIPLGGSYEAMGAAVKAMLAAGARVRLDEGVETLTGTAG